MDNSTKVVVLLTLCVCGAWPAGATAADGLKVVCAARTDTPPKIDGVLDEACWSKAEVRSDFTSPGDGGVLDRATTLRVLYDRNHVYFGFEVFWNDANSLRKGVAGIRATYPDLHEGVWMKKWQYANTYGLELFVDAGASGRNYYQVLFNAAGQCVGLYKAMFECFNISPVVKGAISPSGWTVEVAYPAKNLTAGREWGLNVCRNDDTYYGIWKQVGGNYNNPRLFGRLVMGDYRQWWDAVGGQGASRELAALKTKCRRYQEIDPYFANRVAHVSREMAAMQRAAAQHPPVDRPSFERLYRRYARVRDKVERVRAQAATLAILAGL
jgi:cellulose/xylan binding protein with CBM9 domain